jgi:hypothetical protein
MTPKSWPEMCGALEMHCRLLHQEVQNKNIEILALERKLRALYASVEKEKNYAEIYERAEKLERELTNVVVLPQISEDRPEEDDFLPSYPID